MADRVEQRRLLQEERHAELFLHRPELAAERGLRDTKIGRGARDAAAVGDLNEVTDAAQIHRVERGVRSAPGARKLAGAIAGRALYDGRLDPDHALSLIRAARAAA